MLPRAVDTAQLPGVAHVPSRPRPDTWSRLLNGLSLSLAAATVAGLAGRVSWVLDVASHFRAHYFITAVGIAVLACIVRRARSALLPGMCAVVNLAILMPYYVSPINLWRRGDPGGTTVLRIAAVNVYVANRRFDLLERFVAEANPDVLVLVEVNRAWARGLSGPRSRMPYGVVHARRLYGIAVLSKHACVRCRVLDPADIDSPVIVGEIPVRGRVVTIVGAHFPVPITPLSAALMNLQVESVGALIKNLGGDTVLLGDLNSTPWSAYFRRLVSSSGLRDSALGRGVHTTWPASSPLIGVPIDHALVSPGIRVVRRWVGSSIGSDHLPVVVDIAWP
ncbi:MAG TPA: endonuclease/exonuclease/phosphatase family protein [bacterium]|nr:endonuclease/exonuclease/phosphatase family protein [bacterium]